MLLVCAFAVGANGYYYFSWEIKNCFLKSSWVINIKNAGSRLPHFRKFPISIFQNSIHLSFKVVFLTTVFICCTMLRSIAWRDKNSCKGVSRTLSIRSSWGTNNIKTRFSYPGCRFPFSKYNKVKEKKPLATWVRFRDKKWKKEIGPSMLADLCYATICALGLDKD